MRKKRLVRAYKSERSLSKQKKAKKQSKEIYTMSLAGSLLIISLTIFNVARVVTHNQKVRVNTVYASTSDIYHERQYWSSFLDKSPNYLPGIIRLAMIESQLGNETAAKSLIERAVAISPNDDRVKEANRYFALSSAGF